MKKKANSWDVLTREEGLHTGAVCQFHWCASRVCGQGRVCTVIQKQPDYGEVIACYSIMEGPKETKQQQLFSEQTALK